MRVESFISGRMRFSGALAVCATALSFFIIIIAVSISAGFRKEIGDGLSRLSGDIQIGAYPQGELNELDPISLKDAYVDSLANTSGVEEVIPVIYRAGIVKNDDDIQGVIVKGRPSNDTTTLGVSIPRRLSQLLCLNEGDGMLTYFIGEKVQARKFTVTSIYDAMSDSQDRLIVLASLEDMQRLNRWEEDEVSSIEIKASPETDLHELTSRLEKMSGMMCINIREKYSALFDWLNLIDTNVVAILILMIIVAGFNMISGLLIMLFRSTSTIGTLKALGMNNRSIAGVFLRTSGRTLGMGLLIGNVAAILFCLLQGSTHLIKLNPANYFLSYVPVSMDVPAILIADVAAFVLIELLLLLPCIFISKVDPALTVRQK